MIHCHSPGGDAAAALSDIAFYMTHIQSPEGDSATALAECVLSEPSLVVIIVMTDVYDRSR